MNAALVHAVKSPDAPVRSVMIATSATDAKINVYAAKAAVSTRVIVITDSVILKNAPTDAESAYSADNVSAVQTPDATA